MRKRIPGNWVGAGPCHSYGPEGGESRCEWHLGAEVTHPTSGWAGPGRQEHESWAERGTGGGWRGAASCQMPGGEAGPPRARLVRPGAGLAVGRLERRAAAQCAEWRTPGILAPAAAATTQAG